MERGFVCRVTGLLRGGVDNEGRPALNVVTGIIKGTCRKGANEEEQHIRSARTIQHLSETISQRNRQSRDTTKDLTHKLNLNTNPEEDNSHLDSTLTAIKDHLQSHSDNRNDTNVLEKTSTSHSATYHQSKDQKFKSMHCTIHDNIVTCYDRENKSERQDFRVPDALSVAHVSKVDLSPDPNRVISIVSVPVDTEESHKGQETHSCSHSDQEIDQNNMNQVHGTVTDYHRPYPNNTIPNARYYQELAKNTRLQTSNFIDQSKFQRQSGQCTTACCVNCAGTVDQLIPQIAPYSSPEIGNEPLASRTSTVEAPSASHVPIEQNGVGVYERSHGQYGTPNHLISTEHRGTPNQPRCPRSCPLESVSTENVQQSRCHFDGRSSVPRRVEGVSPSPRRFSSNPVRRGSLTSSGLGSSPRSNISRFGSSSSIASYTSEDSVFCSTTGEPGPNGFEHSTANDAMRQDRASWHVTTNGRRSSNATCRNERVGSVEIVYADQHGRHPSREQHMRIVPQNYNMYGHHYHDPSGLTALTMNAADSNPLNQFHQHPPVAINQDISLVPGYRHAQERPTATQASTALTTLAEKVNVRRPVVQQLPVISEVFTCNFGGSAVMESEQQPNIVSPYIVHFDDDGKVNRTETTSAGNRETYQSVNVPVLPRPPPSYEEALKNIIRHSGDQNGQRDVVPYTQASLQVQTPQDARNVWYQLHSSPRFIRTPQTTQTEVRTSPKKARRRSKKFWKQVNVSDKARRRKSKSPRAQLEKVPQESANAADGTQEETSSASHQLHSTEEVESEAAEEVASEVVSQTQQPIQLQEPTVAPDSTSEQAHQIRCRLQSTQQVASEAPQTQQPKQQVEPAIAPESTAEQEQNRRCQLHSRQQFASEAHLAQQPKQSEVHVTNSAPEQAHTARCQLDSTQHIAQDASQTQQPKEPQVHVLPDSTPEQARRARCQVDSTQQVTPETPPKQRPEEPQVHVICDSTPNETQDNRCRLHPSEQVAPEAVQTQQPNLPHERAVVADSTQKQTQDITCQLHSTQSAAPEAPLIRQPKQAQVHATDSATKQRQSVWCQVYSTQQVALKATPTQQPSKPQVHVFIPDSTPKDVQCVWRQLHSEQKEASPTQQPNQPQVHVTIPDSTPKQAPNTLHQLHLTQQAAESPELPRPKPSESVNMPNATRDENMQLLQQNQKTLEDLTKAVASLEAAIQQLQRHQQSPNLPPNPVHLQDVSSLSTQLQHPPTQGLARQSEREAPVHEKTLPPAVKDIQTRLDELTRSMTGIRSNINSKSQAEVTQNDPNYHNSPALSIPCEKQVNIANLIEPWKRTSSPMPATTLHYPAQTVSNPIHNRIGLQHTATKGHHRSVQQSDPGKVNRQKTTFNSGFPNSNASREVPYTIPSIFPLRKYGSHPQNTGQAYLEDAFTGRPAEKSREGGYVFNGVWRNHKDQIVPNVEISHSLHSTPEIHIQRPKRAEATCSKAQTEEGQNGTKGSEQQHCTLEYQRQSLEVLESQQQNNQREADMHGCRENVQLSEEGHDISTVTQQPENTEQCHHDQGTFHTYTGKEHMKKEAEMQFQKESSEEIEGQHQQHIQLTGEDHGGQITTQHLDQMDQCQQDQETFQTYDGQEHIKIEGDAQYQIQSLEEKQQNEKQETDKHEYQQQPQLPGKSNDCSMVTEQPDNIEQNQEESFQTNARQEHIHIRKEGETDYQQKSHEKLEGQQQSTQREAENYKQLLQPEGSQGDSMVTQHSMDHVDQCEQEPLKAHSGQEHFKKEREMQCQKESLEGLEDQQQNNQKNADSHQYHGQPQLPEETHNVQSSIDELEQRFQEPCQTQTVQDHFKKEEGTRWQNESLEEHECQQQGNQQETDRHRYQEQHQITEGTHDGLPNIQQSDNLDQCLQEPYQAQAVQDHLSKEGETQWQKESLERLEAQQQDNRQGADRNEYKEQIELPNEAHDSQSSIQQSNILDQRVQEPCQTQTVHDHFKKKEETHQYQSKSVEETEGPQQDNQGETDRNDCQDHVQIPKECHDSAMVTQQPDNWKQRLRKSTQTQNVQEHKKEGKTDGQQPDQAIPEPEEPRRKRRSPSGDQSKSDPKEINASIKLRRFATMEMQKGTSKDHTKVILKTTKWAVINKPWTQLNKAQHDRLEEVFQVWKNRRVEKTLIFQLSEELNLPERQIKMWFYNRKEREAKSKEFLAKKTPDVFRCSTTLFDSGCPLDPLAALRTNPRQLSVEDCAVVVQHLQIQLNKIINP